MEITQIAGGVVMVDITDRLPRHKKKRYRPRSGSIERIYFHKSGRLGKPGFDGAKNSARYCVDKRGWPGMPYTFWLPFEPEYHYTAKKRSIVLFRCQPDEIASYHTGGKANQIGVAACFQGNSTVDGLSPNQIELAEALIPWAFERYGLELPSGLSWHSDTSPLGPPKKKPVCPGTAAVRWLEKYRGIWLE